MRVGVARGRHLTTYGHAAHTHTHNATPLILPTTTTLSTTTQTTVSIVDVNLLFERLRVWMRVAEWETCLLCWPGARSPLMGTLGVEFVFFLVVALRLWLLLLLFLVQQCSEPLSDRKAGSSARAQEHVIDLCHPGWGSLLPVSRPLTPLLTHLPTHPVPVVVRNDKCHPSYTST